jgi:DNA adenine methylase
MDDLDLEEIEEFSKSAGKEFKWAALGYYGGKYNALRGLLKYFPLVTSHTTYVEPFAGSSVVAINYNPVISILNDGDKELTNFLRIFLSAKAWQSLQDYPEAPEEVKSQWRAEAWKWDLFQTIIANICRAKELYDWMSEMAEIDPVVCAAVKYYIGNRNNFSNIPKDGFDYIQARRKPFGEYHYQHYKNFCLTRDVRVWNLDFEDCIDRVREWVESNQGSVFLYADPPYLKEQGYVLRFRKRDLYRLAACLGFYPHHWLMSNEDSPIVRRVFKGCYMKKVRWAYTCAAGCTTTGRHELLISNRPFVKRSAKGRDIREFMKEANKND